MPEKTGREALVQAVAGLGLAPAAAAARISGNRGCKAQVECPPRVVQDQAGRPQLQVGPQAQRRVAHRPAVLMLGVAEVLEA